MKYLAFFCCLLSLPVMVVAGTLPPLVVPQGLGLNINFVSNSGHDLDIIRDNGARAVRMDFFWRGIEKEKGVYTFTGYDQMTDALLARGIRPLYILDYGNPLYAQDGSVRTEECRQAFARFAAAAALHFKGKPILWELWNEPNITTWKPAPSAAEYTELAKTTIPAMRKADPQVTVMAGATSLVDLPFLEECFRHGLLPLVDAISVHPYRLFPPETLENDITRLRALIARYSPQHPDIPIISSEWGYSTVKISYDDVDMVRQGQYFPRVYLMSLSLRIPVSVWFKWKDDGTNPNDPEHHFGTLLPDFRPKPSYQAAQQLVTALNGMHFVKRLPSAPEDYLFVFTNDTAYTLAIWTTGKTHTLDILPGKRIEITGDPQYLPVPLDAAQTLAEAAWSVDVKTPFVMCGGNAKGLAPEFAVNVRNPFNKPVPVTVRVLD
ncbi:MAG TPA: cellulase family glycosylhydrolase, partial [Armatimonadota bacterium]|nr:cellulase family glycosylhydrolase [Armatimonadota bacterium]